MKKNIEQLSIIKLVGISACTSNALEFSQNNGKISKIMQKFFTGGMQSQIPNQKTPTKVFAVYTDYKSDEHGYYTYFLGKEVDNFDNISQDFSSLIIPNQTYMKFTSNPGKIPEVVTDMWQSIWQMNVRSLGGKRAFIADFEIYDERNRDPDKSIVDIYIGLKSTI